MEIGIILIIIFVVLRLIGVIHWSWWWVLAPLWIGAAIIGIMFATAGIRMLFILRRLRKRLRALSQRWWGSAEGDETPPQRVSLKNGRLAVRGVCGLLENLSPAPSP
jgi:hypothetical protein